VGLLPDIFLLRIRALLAVLFAVFVAPLTLWLRGVGLLLREPGDFVLEPLDLVPLDAAPVLPVVDLMLAALALLDMLAILPAILPSVLPDGLPVVFPVVPPAVFPAAFMEADEVERLFFIPAPSPSLLPLILCMAAPSLPNSSAV